MWNFKGVKVHWLGHDSIVLEGSRTVAIDPFKTNGRYASDILLISHEHSDHLSDEDIPRFIGPATVIVAPRICENQLRGYRNEKRFVAPGESFELRGVGIETVPAYNTNKFREPGKVFHPKADGRVGYVVKLDGVTFYHSGDTDHIPEMRAIKTDVAFLPVSGTYVMTAEEAAQAAQAMSAQVVVPFHWGAIVGSKGDADRFRALLGGKPAVELLEKE